MLLRRIHRWLGVVGSLLLIYIACTGLIMQVMTLLPRNGAPQEQNRGMPPDLRLKAIRIRDAQRGLPPGKPSPEALAALAAAKAAPPPKMKVDFGRLLIILHGGEFYGIVGVWIGLICGLILMFLSVSGLYMYGKVYKARLRLGRKNPFW